MASLGTMSLSTWPAASFRQTFFEQIFRMNVLQVVTRLFIIPRHVKTDNGFYEKITKGHQHVKLTSHQQLITDWHPFFGRHLILG